MHHTTGKLSNVMAAALALAVLASSHGAGAATASGRLSLEPAGEKAEESLRQRTDVPSLAEPLAAGLLLASALASLLWLRSRQTRSGKA